MSGRYEKFGPVEAECEACGETGTASATHDTWADVAAWSCPHCGHTQEAP